MPFGTLPHCNVLLPALFGWRDSALVGGDQHSAVSEAAGVKTQQNTVCAVPEKCPHASAAASCDLIMSDSAMGSQGYIV